MRVLIVDDQPDARDEIRRLLLPHVARLEVAEAPVTAEALAERGYDAMLIEVVQPGLDGAALIGRLRAIGVPARLIAMSGGAAGRPAREARASAEAQGADAVLFKPFTPDRLYEALLGKASAAAE